VGQRPSGEHCSRCGNLNQRHVGQSSLKPNGSRSLLLPTEYQYDGLYDNLISITPFARLDPGLISPLLVPQNAWYFGTPKGQLRSKSLSEKFLEEGLKDTLPNETNIDERKIFRINGRNTNGPGMATEGETTYQHNGEPTNL